MKKPHAHDYGWAHLVVPLCAFWVWLAPLSVHADTPVATATEVAGFSETRVGDATVQVVPLTEFLPGSRVRLTQDALVTVLFYATGGVYRLSGPALMRFTDSEVQALRGKEPKRLPAATGRDGKRLLVRQSEIMQAGVVARGISKPITAVSPAGEITLDPRPNFSWQAVEAGLSYQFVLRDQVDRVIARADMQTTSYELPPSVTLSPETRYRWSVSTKSSDGTLHVFKRSLRTADDALRAEVDNFRPQQDASVTRRIAFALWLAQVGLADEARTYWKKLAEQGVEMPAALFTVP